MCRFLTFLRHFYDEKRILVNFASAVPNVLIGECGAAFGHIYHSVG